MGFPERRAGRSGPSAGDPARFPDRYRPQPGARNGGSGVPSHDPARSRRSNTEPVGLPATAPAGPRTDLTVLLGRSVLSAATQQICREYGLAPHPAEGAGLTRTHLARDAGVELAADAHGIVTAVFLHCHGDDGFAPFTGDLPAGAGADPRRAAMWAALGRPDVSGDPYRDRYLGDFGPWDRWRLPACTMDAQYALDGETLRRLTLTRPGDG